MNNQKSVLCYTKKRELCSQIITNKEAYVYFKISASIMVAALWTNREKDKELNVSDFWQNGYKVKYFEGYVIYFLKELLFKLTFYFGSLNPFNLFFSALGCRIVCRFRTHL